MPFSKHQRAAKSQERGADGKFVAFDTPQEVTSAVEALESKVDQLPPLITKQNDYPATLKDADPPLVSLKVTNPVTYLKNWWSKIIGNQAVKFSINIPALTAVFIVFMLLTGTVGIGLMVNYIAKSPAAPYVPAAFFPTPTPDPWRDTGYSGLLKEVGGIFYLLTGDGEAITLSIPQNINLGKYVGKRIFATGKFNRETGIMQVLNASDLEVLPTNPTIVPTTQLLQNEALEL